MKFCIFDMDFSRSIYFLLSNISKINHRCSFSFYSISYWNAFRCICSIALSDMMDMQGSGVSGSAVDSRSWRATMDWIWNWDGISWLGLVQHLGIYCVKLHVVWAFSF